MGFKFDWKGDMDTFIFNLNKNYKYKKLTYADSIYCNSSYGPYIDHFGCWRSSMKSVSNWANRMSKYDNCSNFLSGSSQEKIFELPLILY